MDLKDKDILITGASSGIGKAVALALSHGHNRIAIVARRTELLSDVADTIQKNGSEALAIVGDALDEEQAADAFTRQPCDLAASISHCLISAPALHSVSHRPLLMISSRICA